MLTKIKKRFEQGPIRPPNEARSLLLRFTRNCPWNQCLFCPVYKKRKFSLRSVEEIKADIDVARSIADEIIEFSQRLGHGGRVNDAVMGRLMGSALGSQYQGIAMWLYYGTGSCFLQDADNLVMQPAELVEALSYLRQRFPEIKRVTTYSRSRTIVRREPDELVEIHGAGLDRVHVGLESGCDQVLKMVKKGVSAQQHVEAGRKIIDSGMELSEYVMPGLGGQEMWLEHAEESARVLNLIDPHFIRIRSLRVPERVPLYKKIEDGSFTMQTDDKLAEELRVFIGSLEGISSVVTSDHIMNLLEDVSGRLMKDKERMLLAVKKYQELSEEERLIYRIGRRGGAYRSTDDLSEEPATYEKLRSLVREIVQTEGREGVEKFISEMVDRYI